MVLFSLPKFEVVNFCNNTSISHKVTAKNDEIVSSVYSKMEGIKMKVDFHWILDIFNTNSICVIEKKEAALGAQLHKLDKNKDGRIQENELASVDFEYSLSEKTKDGRMAPEEFQDPKCTCHKDDGKTKIQYDSEGHVKKTYVNDELMREDYRDGSYAVYGQNGTRVLYDAENRLLYGTQEAFGELDELMPKCDKASKSGTLMNLWNTLWGNGKDQKIRELSQKLEGFNNSELYLYHLQTGGKILEDLGELHKTLTNKSLSKEFGSLIDQYKLIIEQFDQKYPPISEASASAKKPQACTDEQTSVVAQEPATYEEYQDPYYEDYTDYEDYDDYDTDVEEAPPVQSAPEVVDDKAGIRATALAEIETAKGKLNEILNNPMIPQDIKDRASAALGKLTSAESNTDILNNGATDVLNQADGVMSEAVAGFDNITSATSGEIIAVSDSIGASNTVVEAALSQTPNSEVLASALVQASGSVELAQSTLNKHNELLLNFQFESNIPQFSQAKELIESLVANSEQNLKEAQALKTKVEQAQSALPPVVEEVFIEETSEVVTTESFDEEEPLVEEDQSA